MISAGKNLLKSEAWKNKFKKQDIMGRRGWGLRKGKHRKVGEQQTKK